MKNTMIILLFFVGIRQMYAQQNAAFSKNYEHAIYEVNYEHNQAMLSKAKLDEGQIITKEQIRRIETTLLEKEGFFDFVYNKEENMFYIYHLSTVSEKVVKGILNDTYLSYKYSPRVKIELKKKK